MTDGAKLYAGDWHELMVRNRYILLSDLPLIAIAASGAFALRFDWLFVQHRPEFMVYLAAAVILKPLVFFPFGMYSRYWRYGTAQDLIAITLAVSAASVLMAVFVWVVTATGNVVEFARPVLMIDWLLTLALTGGLRMSVRVIGDARETSHKPVPSDRKNVLIVGAGEAGTLVARELHRNPQLGLHPVAFLDDAVAKNNKRILGIPVRGPLSSLEAVVRQEAVSEVIIAMPTASGTVVRDAAAACRRAGVQALASCPGYSSCSMGTCRSTASARSRLPTCCAGPKSSVAPNPVAVPGGTHCPRHRSRRVDWLGALPASCLLEAQANRPARSRREQHLLRAWPI